MNTFNFDITNVEKKWYVVDAEGVVLGRLAAEIAMILRGKHRPFYTPHINTGENIIVINAEKVKLTGNKKSKEKFFWHTGYPGGIKERVIGKILSGSYPERVLKKAVERMMPKESPLARAQFKNLHVYSGSEHPHQAQNPIVLNIATKNPKNKR